LYTVICTHTYEQFLQVTVGLGFYRPWGFM